MTMAHIGSRLFPKGMTAHVPEDAYFFPFYQTTECTTANIPIELNSAVLTQEVKKFNGSVFLDTTSCLKYDISNLLLKDKACIGCWIYITPEMVSGESYQYLIKLGSMINDDFYYDAVTLRIKGDGENKQFEFLTYKTNTSSQTIVDTKNVKDYGVGTWHHFVMQWNKDGFPSGKNKELYIDGQLIRGVDTINLPDNVLKALYVGSWGHTGDVGYLTCNTYFEQLIILPRTLTAEEIKALYTANQVIDTRDDVLYWEVPIYE